MCGIVGYTGSRPAAPILLAGLSHLEYRGYDSAGLAVREGGGEIEIVKTRGRLRALYDMTNSKTINRWYRDCAHTLGNSW